MILPQGNDVNRRKIVLLSNFLSQELDPYHYDPSRWRLRRRFCRLLLRYIAFTMLINLDGIEGLENLPAAGPAILFINHIAFVDPIILVHVTPRDIVPMAKIEVYEYPGIGIFPRLWGVIPVHRQEVDRRAIRQALSVLEADEVVLVAPEGTRNPALAQGKEGVAYLASRSGAPIIPVAITGTPGFPALRFTSRWKGTGVRVRFGPPFRFSPDYQRPDREQLRRMTDEAMYILARMLPDELRGVYADLSQASEDTILWL
jgi:1-acyl-sn-glycerol-3-phosphate acyltransferase